MTKIFNRARMTTSTTGTGTVTLGSAVSDAFATFAEAGVSDSDTLVYCIEEGNDFEIGRGTYTASGTTLSRDTVLLSKISGTAGTSKMNLGGAAEVFVVAAAEDLVLGPASSTSGNLPSFNSTDGRLLQDSGVAASDVVGTSNTQTLTNKTVDLTDNTLTGTSAEFDTANSDGNFAFDGGAHHDGFSDFVANEHVDHTGVTLTAGDGLTGGGDISVNRSFAVGAGTGITVNANDVQISNDGVDTTQLADEAVTYAKMQHVSATSRVLGRDTAGAGDVEEIAEAGFKAMFNLEIGTDVQAFDADTLKADTGDTLTAGYLSDSYAGGTQSSGTYTPAPSTGEENIQHITNGGAFTLDPLANPCTVIVEITNNASAGSITTSNFDVVDGDSFDTTNGNSFMCFIAVTNSKSYLNVKAMQ